MKNAKRKTENLRMMLNWMLHASIEKTIKTIV